MAADPAREERLSPTPARRTDAPEGRPAHHAQIEELLDKLPRLVRAANRRLGNALGPLDLEDAEQEVAAVALVRLPSWRGEGQLATWLFGIARFCILSRLRARRRFDERFVPAPEDLERQLQAARERPGVDTLEFQRAVLREVQTMPETAVLILRERTLEGRSFEEIGARLGMSESAAKSRYHRCLTLVRSRLAGLVDRDA